MPDRPKRRRITMAEVAKHAGVSQTTVSLVINNPEPLNIPEETRERVLAAVKELGYRPNAAARHMRTNQSNLIGFITDEIATTPFAGKIIRGAQDAAWAKGKLQLVLNTEGNRELEEAAIEMFLERQVEGIIYATMYHRIVDPPAIIREVPVVLLDCYCEDRSLPSVVPDEVQGGRKATELLLQKGHRSIGFLNSIDSIPARFGRLEGYVSALEDNEVPVDHDLVLAEHSDAEGGYVGANSLMQLSEPPTAIFCFNDRMAMGVYDALRDRGLRIPEDVAVMGFDNQEIIAAHLRPPLTTMELPHYQMGQWAVNYLIELGDDLEMVALTQRLIECPVIERSSV